MNPRKRRTVLWLFNEDYDYLTQVAKTDSDSKNMSLTRLIRHLRRNNITSFIKLIAAQSQAEPSQRTLLQRGKEAA